MNLIDDFIAFLAKNEIPPANKNDIIADNTRRYYAIEGDKSNTKKGRYIFSVEDDFAIGWAIGYRNGTVHTYSSKSDKKFSPEQLAEWKEKLRIAKIKQETELKASREKAAEKANNDWISASIEGEHAYLTRKKIGLNGARILGDKIIVPVRIDGKITSLQTISENGDKMFAAGGEIKAGYFALATKNEELGKICVAEGFATGCTIREVTKLPVVVAFNAGNLRPVALAIKAKFPQAEIIIASDNDRKGKINVGVEKANQAAAAIGGCRVIIPPFADDEDGSDFNDLAALKGIDSVRELFLEMPSAPPVDDCPVSFAPLDADFGEMPDWEVPPIDAYYEQAKETVKLFKDTIIKNPDWRKKLAMDDKGRTLKTMQNTLLMLQNDEILSNIFCYDEFCNEKIVYRCPPWQKENVDRFIVRTVTDADRTMLSIELEKRGVAQPFATVDRLLDAIIKENSRNPAKDYFNSLVWDGIKRLDTWLIDYCGAKKDDHRYVSAVGRKWLTAAVTRVFHAGAKFDHMLVLEGKQRIGKSYVFRELATFHGKTFFDDTLTIPELGSLKATLTMQGKIIIEFAELSGLAKADSQILKQTITNQDDRVRLNYSNEITTLPRKFVLAGTYNPDGVGIFTDTTGNERFWVVAVGDKLDIEGIKRDKEQLWAEAVVAYKAGEKLYLESEIAQLARNAQEERFIEDPWEGAVSQLTHNKDKIFMKNIWNALGITDMTKRSKLFQSNISKIMTKLGFEKTKLRDNGSPEIAWRRKEQFNFNEEIIEF